MKEQCIYILLLLTYPSFILSQEIKDSAQDTVKYQAGKNSVFLQVLGNAGLTDKNYEGVFIPLKKTSISDNFGLFQYPVFEIRNSTASQQSIFSNYNNNNISCFGYKNTSLATNNCPDTSKSQKNHKFLGLSTVFSSNTAGISSQIFFGIANYKRSVSMGIVFGRPIERLNEKGIHVKERLDEEKYYLKGMNLSFKRTLKNFNKNLSLSLTYNLLFIFYSERSTFKAATRLIFENTFGYNIKIMPVKSFYIFHEAGFGSSTTFNKIRYNNFNNTTYDYYYLYEDEKYSDIFNLTVILKIGFGYNFLKK